MYLYDNPMIHLFKSLYGFMIDSRPRLVTRMGIQQYLDVGDEWRPREWTGNEGETSLKYEYRVTCLSDYYGDACDKTCRPRNDTFGHYTCSDQGDKICLPGWDGSYCEKRKYSFISGFLYTYALVLLPSFYCLNTKTTCYYYLTTRI